ncbi:hypothetical protein THASP1DRAFT_29343 [Thamnocephalis sphaerospora]|uniref:CCR4-NOT transcription complex subunit 11 n=1 Tax=Thamnocephalis sphaerospora TaxID=78915 RepID=A0A4P9XRZ1_9FUNG|nr:hypothetical protein THASP1DRAFT_29343 [Thamnocephalis sphaerospora]|eukprot:RKP08858.1 hypothetical protein THASP1DRAFT_29343 [Thamnocephalis sphaerospora]
MQTGKQDPALRLRGEETPVTHQGTAEPPPPLNLFAYPPPLMNMHPSKPVWVAPSWYVHVPLWDDSMLATFGLSEEDVQAALAAETKATMQSTPKTDNSNATLSSDDNASPKEEPENAVEGEDAMGTELGLLLRTASETPMHSQQVQRIEQLVRDVEPTKLFEQITLDVREWTLLMEHNSRVAVMLLDILLAQNEEEPEDIAEGTSSIDTMTIRLIHMNILADAPLTLRTAEIIHQLAKNRRLGAQFLADYVTSQMATCSTTRDASAAERKARLLSVLLQSLIHTGALDLGDEELAHYRIEWQSFCLEFSRVREVAAMYQSLTAANST